MYLARPSFRPWRILFALCALPLVYFLAGVLYEVPWEILSPVKVLATLPFVLVLNFMMGYNTVYYLGFPPIPPIHGEPTNLYPIIVPLVLLLFAFATRAVRFGRKPSDSSAGSGDPYQSVDQ